MVARNVWSFGRRLSTLAVVLSAFLAWSGAEAQPLLAGEEAQGWSTKLRLLDANGKSKTHFKPGEQLRLELSITNKTGSNQTLTHFGDGLVRFQIHDSDGLVFSSPDRNGKKTFEFKPGQTRIFGFNWKQGDDRGKTVTAGAYQAKAQIQPIYAGPQDSTPLEFNID